MDYNCRAMSLSRTLVTGFGILEPLCNLCKCTDCSNPVEFQKVSMMGVEKKWRLIVRGGEPCIVVDCEGFTK